MTLVARTSLGNFVVRNKEQQLVAGRSCLGISFDGSILYLPGCSCGQCSKNNREIAKFESDSSFRFGTVVRFYEYDTFYSSLGFDLVATIFKQRQIRIYRHGTLVADLSTTKRKCCGVAKGDKDSVYLFEYDSDNKCVWIRHCDFEQHISKILPGRIRSFGGFFGLDIQVENGKLFFPDTIAVRVYNLLENKEEEPISVGDADCLEAYGEHICICAAKRYIHIYDLRLRQRVLNIGLFGTWGKCTSRNNKVATISPDFTRVATSVEENSSGVIVSSLVPMSIDLCCLDLPPYVLLLVLDWLFALQNECSIEAAERWHHNRKIAFICMVKDRIQRKTGLR